VTIVGKESQERNSAMAGAGGESDATYILGPGDRLALWVQEAEEFNGKTFRIEHNGNVHLPLVGPVRAGGLRVFEFEQALHSHLAVYLRQPIFSITVTEYSSQPVTIVGMVARPGTFQMRGTRTLLEMLNEAGGLREEAASYARITRKAEQGKIPLGSAVVDPLGQYSVAELTLAGLLTGEDTSQNIVLRPGDIVSVPRVEWVFVIGQVARQGNVQVSEREGTTVLKAIALAGGMTPAAKPAGARILRPILGGPKRAELPVDLRAILDGKAGDMPLQPDDILYVPENTRRKATTRAIDLLTTVGLQGLVWSLVAR
jgi:polysaccharide export outer membrane protein